MRTASRAGSAGGRRRRRGTGVFALAVLALTGATLASAAVIQKDGLRLTVLAQVQPFKLPRTGTAPIAVFVAGGISTPSGAVPPQLQRMTVEVNRHGLLSWQGLPTCRLEAIRTASSGRALDECADALVGSGRFWATIVLSDQRPYPTRGRLLVFNGRREGRPVLLAHIYTTKPFGTSFVIPFEIRNIDGGRYGTELRASLPEALGTWGFVDRIKLTLRRKYSFRGRAMSYFRAGCPAPAGARYTVYPLARVSFEFAEDRRLALSLNKSCGVSR